MLHISPAAGEIDLGNDQSPWKVVVLMFAAGVGIWLGVAGMRAPRLNTEIASFNQSSALHDPAPIQRATRQAHTTADERAAYRTPRVGDVPRSSDAPDGTGREIGAENHRASQSGVSGLNFATPRFAAVAQPGAPGPLLSDMWYTSRAHELYPTMTLAPNDRILTGFQISLRAVDPSTEAATVTNLQDNTSQTATFDRTNHLYFIETRMGDDGFDGETNLSDDGFVLTDPQGHIIGQ